MTDDVEARLQWLEAQVRYLAQRMGVALPQPVPDASTGITAEIAQLAASGNKIAAIKAYREATGCDLATAKNAIDALG
jgi:ribosomal protein L7/L12